MQISLSGYGGCSELHIVNMPSCDENESLYCHSVRVSPDQSTVISAVTVANSGNQVAFVNALAFRGIHVMCLY